MQDATKDFSGKWRVTLWYPTKDDSGENSDHYDLDAFQDGNRLVLESKQSREGYVFIRLNIEGRIASGSWHENAALDGDFEGAEYSGAGQMIIDSKGQKMAGLWAGAGIDRKTNKPKIYTGRWQIERR